MMILPKSSKVQVLIYPMVVTRYLLEWSKSLSYPLVLGFDVSFEEGVYSKLWRKTNIIPIKKK